MRRYSSLVKVLVSAALICPVTPVSAQTPVKLVANPLPTLVSEETEPARLNQLISKALEQIGVDAELVVDRPAFSGSGLLTGKYDGEFAHLTLDSPRDNLLYSKPYLPALLYVASRKYPLDEVTQFSHLPSARVATTNRIANTPSMREVRAVSWVRNPTLFDMFSQLSQQRADYVFEDALVLAEFNRLLVDDGELPLQVSPQPLVKSALTISLRKDYPGAAGILREFDNYISRIQQNGEYNEALAISWTLRDINDDGIADWITSSNIYHDDTPPMSQKGVLPLDKFKPGDKSLFVVDGETYTQWEQAQAVLQKNTSLPRPSLLDHEVYKRMLRRW
ncbi:substrate-binding periplasmic protein [Alteromonas lipolytica]|uniref:Solute-binding protein family 3/N-terminal domain-containing protein n=1 Tax=Alteromonas lipolytica TaxID=1856405 RepID=A0A1E8FCN4_9ALTE|nr:transporter substrate-binding domain-containing protein [Alteromonas lipolytica]OFI33680.1 hypothetical protein BFC17_19055 [Alteromonas lipolytica]GGF69374.1 hypothetical protein GCM10011338_21940 [Alteromonas lipolytica]